MGLVSAVKTLWAVVGPNFKTSTDEGYSAKQNIKNDGYTKQYE